MLYPQGTNIPRRLPEMGKHVFTSFHPVHPYRIVQRTHPARHPAVIQASEPADHQLQQYRLVHPQTDHAHVVHLNASFRHPHVPSLRLDGRRVLLAGGDLHSWLCSQIPVLSDLVHSRGLYACAELLPLLFECAEVQETVQRAVDM